MLTEIPYYDLMMLIMQDYIYLRVSCMYCINKYMIFIMFLRYFFTIFYSTNFGYLFKI
jgi:hypothetical protein